MSSTNTVTKTIALGPGEKFVLPTGAQIKSLIQRNGGVAFSTCDLPAPTAFTCYGFKWEDDGDDASTRNIVVAFVLDDVEHPLDSSGYNDVDMDNAYFVITKLNSHPVLSTYVQAFCGVDLNGKHTMVVAVPENSSRPELKILDRMSTGDFHVYVKGMPDTECAECQNFI